MTDEFTTIVAVGQSTIAELAAVFPTWWHFRPEIFKNQFWVVRDPEVSTEDILRATRGCVDRILDQDMLDEPGEEDERGRMARILTLATRQAPTPNCLLLYTNWVATFDSLLWLTPDGLEEVQQRAREALAARGFPEHGDFVEMESDLLQEIENDLEHQA